MKLFISAFIILLLSNTFHAQNHNNFITHFEKSDGFETATYTEVIQFYEALAKTYPQINIQTIGETDSGKPLHIVTLNPDKVFDFSIITHLTQKNHPFYSF